MNIVPRHNFPWALKQVPLGNLLTSVTHKSAKSDHVVDYNHLINWDEARIVGKESDRYKRWIKEAIVIRKHGTKMSAYQLYFYLFITFDGKPGKSQ